MEYTYECILCIVNAGFADTVMDAARAVGARGGTVLHAHGTAAKSAESFLGITIHDEKEIVMILVPSEIKNSVMQALYKEVGLDSPGQGIVFALPVEDVVGLTPVTPQKKEEKQN